MVCLQQQPPERIPSDASARESISLLAAPARRAFSVAGRGTRPLEREAPAPGDGLGPGPARGFPRPCSWRGGTAQEGSRGSGPVFSSQGGVQYLRDRGFGRALEAGQDAAAAVRVAPGGRAAKHRHLLAGLCRVRRQPAAGAFAPGLDRGDPGRAAGRSHRPRQHGHRGPRADGARETRATAAQAQARPAQEGRGAADATAPGAPPLGASG